LVDNGQRACAHVKEIIRDGGERESQSQRISGAGAGLVSFFLVCCLVGGVHSLWACVFAGVLSGKGPTPYHKKLDETMVRPKVLFLF